MTDSLKTANAGKLSSGRRLMMHRLIAGEPRNVHLMYQVQMYQQCDWILSWLIKNQLSGSKLADWVMHEHGGSALSMIGHVLNELEGRRRGVEKRPVFDSDLT